MIDVRKLNPDAIVKTFLAEDMSLPMVMEFIETELEKVSAPMKAVIQIETAIEEMFVNVSHYAYGDQKGDATFIIRHLDDSVEITIVDTGVPFNPLEKDDPDITLSAEERGIGGLGIYMVKKSMDEVHYERQDNMNVFSMIKKVK